MSDNDLERLKIRRAVKKAVYRLGMGDAVKRAVLIVREKKYEAMDEDDKRRSLIRWYKRMTGERLDLEAPQDYNQKIQWLKLYDSTPLKTTLSDKFQVRQWIRNQIGDEYLIPLLGVWDNPEKIDFGGLPGRFILKANHGSEMNYIVRDKSQVDMGAVRRLAKKWLNTPYDLSSLEQQYYAIPRRIIAEKYIEQKDGNLYDYKIHCFGGEPKIIQIIGDRDLNKHMGREAFCDVSWVRNDLMYHTYKQYDEMPKKPETLPEMLGIARSLSRDFAYVRVDLYSVDNTIYFGEMTFTPAAGIGKWGGNEQNRLVGSWISVS